MRAKTERQKFVDDFVAAWTKAMNLDRFDLGLKADGPPLTQIGRPSGLRPRTVSLNTLR